MAESSYNLFAYISYALLVVNFQARNKKAKQAKFFTRAWVVHSSLFQYFLAYVRSAPMNRVLIKAKKLNSQTTIEYYCV